MFANNLQPCIEFTGDLLLEVASSAAPHPPAQPIQVVTLCSRNKYLFFICARISIIKLPHMESQKTIFSRTIGSFVVGNQYLFTSKIMDSDFSKVTLVC